MTAAWYAGCCLLATALLAFRQAAGRRRAVLRARALLPGEGAGYGSGGTGREALAGWWAAARGRPEWLCLPASGLVALLGESPLPLAAGALAVPLVRRRLRAAGARKEREALAGRVVALCEAAGGELRAGRQPGHALAYAARRTRALGPEEARVLAAVGFGGDVAEALRRAARREGAEGLAGLAACWQVAVDSGAGLAAGLDRLEAALREQHERREGLRAELSGAWATVSVLAALPVAGIGLGAVLGAEPLRVLLHTPAGGACLVLGGALEAVGLWWAARIVRGGGGDAR
ncbi:type II secretion system F family protein [Streptomyces sp. NPDC056503]|uniref:type II secretion system F family protein n=1 Tax=Streptomyces sp. NPDC056503 TaxID=3345842 RepID=UPI003685C245